MSNLGDKLKGNWKQIKGKAKQQWGDLTDDDLTYSEGKWDEMVGRIQEKTGEAKDNIEDFFDKAGKEYSEGKDEARDNMD